MKNKEVIAPKIFHNTSGITVNDKKNGKNPN
jgi:hypothetical protein